MLKDTSFSDCLKQLCEDYYYEHQEVPPCPVKSYERMNSLLGGTKKPIVEELIAISTDYDVSINYLLTGDEMFPSLHRIPESTAKQLLQEIEDLRSEVRAGVVMSADRINLTHDHRRRQLWRGKVIDYGQQ